MGRKEGMAAAGFSLHEPSVLLVFFHIYFFFVYGRRNCKKGGHIMKPSMRNHSNLKAVGCQFEAQDLKPQEKRKNFP